MYKEITEKIKELYPGQDFIPLHEPRFWGNDKAYVADAIDSTFVSSVGKYVDRFEEMIREYTGAKYAVAAVNGTAALHMSLVLAGVKRDELVITQPLSFIATCNAISYLGAEPVFVDIDKSTLGLSPDSLKDFLQNETEVKNGGCFHKRSGKRVAACVPMHTFGHAVALDELMEICNTYSIPLVEDAAESIGSKYKGKHTGTLGLLGAFSFNGNKTITCGGGGVIVTDDESLGKLAKHLTTQSKVPHRWEFKHDNIGYNYRMPNLNAALACAQMEQLDNFVTNKRELAAIYKEAFKTMSSTFFTEPENSYSNYWLNALLLKDKEERDEFLTYTNDNGVMTRPVWTLMTNLPLFKHCINHGSENAQFIEDRLVNIPSSVRK
ncbi:aminotransferase DegT [Sphingobacteriaceae bacterium]|nr:aminotransferase DegT [Sphingobacteriaceae bacterium]